MTIVHNYIHPGQDAAEADFNPYDYLDEPEYSDFFEDNLKLTPSIIDPVSIYTMLKGIQGQLLPGFALPFNIDQDLHKYYQQLKCYMERQGNNYSDSGLPPY